ncbi:MAG TPA: hypothetical protein VI230_07055, partial [Ignavibacteriaceae bacterium]
MNPAKYSFYIVILGILIFAYGCSTYMQPLKTTVATVGTPSAVNKDLRSLPPPKDKIVAAVYKFR